MLMLDILNIADKCSACGACVSACPSGCLDLKYDKDGFWYPFLKKDSSCIQCGLCSKTCPILHPGENLPDTMDSLVYSYQSKDEELLKQSSSGGAFSLFADFFLKNKGIVFGCSFNPRTRLFEYADTDHVTLQDLRKAKYVEARTGSVFKEVQKHLRNNREVLFCGTPCHVFGLKAFLGKDFDNKKLFVIDFLCHGVPSSRNFRSYTGPGVTSVDFRYKDFSWKKLGWKEQCLKVQYKNKKDLLTSIYYSPYMIAFGRYIGLRLSCYSCDRVLHSVADVTIGDFWGLAKLHPENKDNRGYSVVMLHSERGKRKWNELSPEKGDTVEDIPISSIQYALHERTFTPAIRRREFFFRLCVRLFGYVPATCMFLPKMVLGRALKKRFDPDYEN